MDNNSEKKYQRRVRYKGTHPKTYQAKYKELNPEKYADDVKHIINKGNTPAGMHRPICVDEILDFFRITPGQVGFDATLGYGGHTLEMLKKLEHKGHIYAVDQDPIELEKTKERLLKQGFDKDILTTEKLNFSDIDLVAIESGPFDFVLADLGVSSMQIDNPERGFSFKTEGPLDLRMNPDYGITGAQRLRNLSEAEIEGMLIENSDEPHAKVIASAITNEYRQGKTILTTTDLQNVIKNSLQFISQSERDKEIRKACARTFQAIRIDINKEYEVLYDFLDKLPNVLKENGKVAILTFHSGEDRLVKKSFKHFYNSGIYKEISSEPIRPTLEEQSTNSRSKSAKLRWAIKS